MQASFPLLFFEFYDHYFFSRHLVGRIEDFKKIKIKKDTWKAKAQEGKRQRGRAKQCGDRSFPSPPGLLSPSSASSLCELWQSATTEMVGADPVAFPTLRGPNVTHFSKHRIPSFMCPQPQGFAGRWGRQNVNRENTNNLRKQTMKSKVVWEGSMPQRQSESQGT